VRACVSITSLADFHSRISFNALSALAKAASILFSRVLMAAKMGFHANFPSKNSKRRKVMVVQNIKPTAGSIKLAKINKLICFCF
jgi:hypothetical protein